MTTSRYGSNTADGAMRLRVVVESRAAWTPRCRLGTAGSERFRRITRCCSRTATPRTIDEAAGASIGANSVVAAQQTRLLGGLGAVAEVGDVAEPERDRVAVASPVMVDGRRGVLDLHVQVRFEAVAGVPAATDHVARSDLLADVDLDRPGTEVCQLDVQVGVELDDDHVAAQVLRVGLPDRDVRVAVFGCDDGAVDGRQQRLVPAVVGGQVVTVTVVGTTIAFDQEVDRVALVGERRPVVAHE